LKKVYFKDLKIVGRLHSPYIILKKFYFFPKELKYLAISIGERINLAFSDYLISPSVTLASLIKNFTKKPILKFPLPLTQEISEDISSKNKRFDLIFPSRLQDGKGIFLFIKACILLLEEGYTFKVLLMGGDTVFNKNSDSVHEKILTIIPPHLKEFFTIRLNVNREDTKKYYRNSSICVIPSLFDNYPYVCLEAMSNGLPIICSDKTGTEEIVNSFSCGLIHNNNDYSDLAMRISILLKDKDLRLKLGNKGKEAFSDDLNPIFLGDKYSILLNLISNDYKQSPNFRDYPLL